MLFCWPRRTLLASCVLCAKLAAQSHDASSVECTFTADPEKFLGRAARARAGANRLIDLMKAARPATARTVSADSIPRRNIVDQEIFDTLAKRGAASAPLSSDEEFFRRIHLDLTGRLPEATAIRAFLADTAKDKRDAAIDRLLGSPEFTDRWTMWMGDWLQNTSTLANAAVQRGAAGRNKFREYMHDAVSKDKPLSTVAAEAIAGKGNNTESGPANFALGASTAMGPIQDTYDTMLSRSATIFLGNASFDCLLCHNGRARLTLTSAWGVSRTRLEAQRMAAFFSRMNFNPANPRGSFDVVDATAGGYDLNTNSGNRPDRNPVGSIAQLAPEYIETQALPADGNWRAAFAENLIRDPMFARNLVNRIWKQMFNLAMVDPVDSMDPARLDPKSPPPAPWDLQATHPELLEKLAAELKAQDFHLRPFLRLLAQSSAYQLSAQFDGDWKDEYVTLFNRRIARRMEAEEVHDAIAQATGVPGEYGWAMQFPDTVEPVNTPVAGFLNAFLRGDRDTQDRSQAGSIQQQLYLMNDAFVTERVKVDRSPKLQAIAGIARNEDLLEEIYLTFLSRKPTAGEIAAGAKRLTGTASRAAAVEDLAWMCINKVEFLFSY